MRYSHQRELILREVLSRSDYPTAEQICTSLRAVCPRLSLGTVYRDLNTLVDIGKVRRVSIPGVLPCAVRPDQNSGGKTYAPTAV